MTNDVRVHVLGNQKYGDERDGDPIELLVEGKYKELGGKQHIRYDEVLGGTTEKTKNHVIIGKDFVEVRKLGEAEVNMYFRKGERCRMAYKTKFGILPIEVKTTELIKRIDEDLIDLEIAYTIFHGREKIADCTMKLKISSL